jgi:6-phosphogluconolactonase
MSDAQNYFVYVGTYASSDKPGIFIYTLDAHRGQLTFVDSVAGITNPSYLAIDNQRLRLYAVSETATFEGQEGGAVVAYAKDPQTGKLTFINQQPTGGADPCYVTVDPTSRVLLNANYDVDHAHGSISAYPLSAYGEIGARTDRVQHEGKGVRPDRQAGPHKHSVVLDKSGKTALVADLGLDKIFIYTIDFVHTKYVYHGETQVAPATGPRHIVFSATGNHVYVINELNNTINHFAYDESNQTLNHLQTVSTLPHDFTGENTAADIHISPDGRFLYGSNRGHDSLAIFRIAQDSGNLTLVQHVSTGGKTPRNFAITPEGRFLLVAHQDSHTIIVFRIDQPTGTLTPTGDTLEIPQPVCIQYCPIP